MQLRKLHLHNFCQHRDREIHFDPGLNLILGPNGSGKSNLIEGIQFAITGDLQKHTREEVICQEAGAKEESGVNLEFQHLDYTLTVFRGIRPVTHTLRCIMGSSGNYMADIEGYKDVNNYLLSLLDLQKKQLEDYVFIAQGTMDGLINKSKEQKTLELAKVFGVADTERIWEALGTKITKIEIPATADIVELEAKAAAASKAVDEIQYQVYQLTEILLSEEEQKEYEQAIAQKHKYEALLKEYYKSRDDLHAINTALVTYSYMADDKRVLCQIQEAIDAAEIAAKTAHSTLGQWQTYKRYAQQVAALETKAAELRRIITARTAVYPGFKSNLEAAAIDLGLLYEMEQEYGVKAAAVEKSIKKAVCVTCKRPFDDYDYFQQELPKLQQKLEETKALITPLVAATECKEDRDKCREAIKVYRGLKQAIGDAVPVPDITEAACNENIKQVQRLQRDYQTLNDYITEKSQEQSQLIGKQTLLQEKVDAIYHKLLTYHTPENSIINRKRYRALVAALEQLKANKNALHELNNNYNQKWFESERYAKELSSALNTVTTRKKLLNTREYLVGLRELFHRGGLPKMLIETYIDTLAEDVNEFLSLFDAPFKVRRGEHLGFDAMFSGCSRVVPDKLLSGGQKVMLSLAFRVALNSRFTSSLGILSLDEPTIHLDKASRACLPAMLERLREVCQLKNIQILFITHDEDLMNLSDNVIQLGA